MLTSGGVIDCVLRNRSANGARLKVASVIGIPDRFKLIIEPAGERRLVRVAWRKEAEVGVAFEDEPTM